MDISRLEIKNFLTVGTASIELDNRGLLLIQGENKDDPSAESNGAGKSSIVDALCWALFGVTARGVTTDAVVNKTAKKDCRVSVTISEGLAIGDTGYEIVRYRKDGTNKNQVFIKQGKMGLAGWIDMSKGTDKETQEVINQVIGCSLDVFMASVYCGQERMPDLPGMTDKQLKLLIEEAAGVEVLSSAYTVARGRLTTAKARLDAALPLKLSAEAVLADAVIKLDGLRDESARFETERKDRAKAELIKALPLKKLLAEANEALAGMDDAGKLIDQLSELDDKLKGEKVERAELDALVKKASQAEMAAVRARTEAQSKKDTMDRAVVSLAKIDERVGTPCGECGKAYCEHDLEDARAAQQAVIDKYKVELRTLAAALKDALEAHKTALAAVESFKVSMTDFTAVAALQRDLTERQSALRLKRGEVISIEKQIASIGEVAKAKLSEANPWSKSVAQTETDIDRLETSIGEVTGKIESLTAETEMLDAAVRVFGPAGVRAHILDTVTPYLNERTREYLGALTDGNIHAEWNTLSKTAKGDLKEKFNIEVVNDKGAESFAGLSGGEKRKVRLATAMALQDMVASRATKPINIFVGDEIDHALDESGLERLMTVLERKARERGTVLVISHNSLSDWIDNVITVTKVGGLATVGGATERGF